MGKKKPHRVLPEKSRELPAVTKIIVGGFKSICEEAELEVRPLTILAGANSSGKSSAMQPLLLLKQTLEAPFDPGALLLDGPNIRFTAVEQVMSRCGREPAGSFHVGIEIDDRTRSGTKFVPREDRKGFDIEETYGGIIGEPIAIRAGMSPEELAHVGGPSRDAITGVRQMRCFLGVGLRFQVSGRSFEAISGLGATPDLMLELIHVPGYRGVPERMYNSTAVGPRFAGPFPPYVATVLADWQSRGADENLTKLQQQLRLLGLTGSIRANAINASQVELLVGRLPGAAPDADDLVNLADVGFGVSQVLPVLVALLVAHPGQLVYLEEPETHLHPRAQRALAEILADAARRGVRVVVETHSSLLLRGVQTLVAKGELAPDLVKLHWFARRDDGTTQIDSADLTRAGTFGGWPVDFDEVSMRAEMDYLDAAELEEAKQNGHEKP